jgi:hypothetical protein
MAPLSMCSAKATACSRSDCRVAPSGRINPGGRPAALKPMRAQSLAALRRNRGVGGGHVVTGVQRRRVVSQAVYDDESAFSTSISALSPEQLAERVVWLPPMRRNAAVMPNFTAPEQELAEGEAPKTRTMPFFALGSQPYLPGTEQVANPAPPYTPSFTPSP